MPQVWNKKHMRVPDDAVYIGRPSRWGNPYTMVTFTREEAIEKFRHYIRNRHEEIREELAGKDLVCWCTPLPCHGDVLLEIANGNDDT